MENVLAKELEKERTANEKLRERNMELESEITELKLRQASQYAATVDDN